VLTSQIKGPKAFKKMLRRRRTKQTWQELHHCWYSIYVCHQGGFGLGQTQMIGLVGVTKLI